MTVFLCILSALALSGMPVLWKSKTAQKSTALGYLLISIPWLLASLGFAALALWSHLA